MYNAIVGQVILWLKWQQDTGNPMFLIYVLFEYSHRIITWCSWQNCFGGLRWSSRLLWSQKCLTTKAQVSFKFWPYSGIHSSNSNFGEIEAPYCIAIHCESRVWSCACCVTSDPLSVLKSMPAIPISKATKRSFMERPPSPERPRYASPNDGIQHETQIWCDMCTSKMHDKSISLHFLSLIL